MWEAADVLHSIDVGANEIEIAGEHLFRVVVPSNAAADRDGGVRRGGTDVAESCWRRSFLTGVQRHVIAVGRENINIISQDGYIVGSTSVCGGVPLGARVVQGDFNGDGVNDFVVMTSNSYVEP